jgi:pyrimidine-specific ribonucleoside hydrolase
LDVDTGVDDALAIMLAVKHPALDVRGITTVVGNVDLEQVTRNTLQVLDVAGAAHVPVVVGADRPLVAPARSAAVVHGADGLGNPGLPPPSRRPDGDDAVAFLRQELLAAPEPVTLIALAPLTNIALLFETAPEVKAKIRRIGLMGGAVEIGNATSVAEFNIFHDPEAADIVFRSGVPILMYGLDVFREVTFHQDEVSRWFASPGELAARRCPDTVPALAAHIFHFLVRNFGRPDVSIGDAGCVASVIDQGGLTTAHLPVAVELHGTHTRGMTVVDRRPRDHAHRHAPDGAANAEVALDVDIDFYRRLFREAIVRDDEN